MSNPQPVSPGNYGQPVYPVQESGPGVEVVQAFDGGYGTPVNVVSEMGPGVRAVYFVNGLPHQLDQSAQHQQMMAQAAHSRALSEAARRREIEAALVTILS